MGISYIMQEVIGRVMDHFWDQTRDAAGTPINSMIPYKLYFSFP